MQEKLFLLTSKRATKRLTEVFDFVWPTASAIWNLRWQVAGYVAVAPNATEAELLGRFVAGSNIRGANLRRACISSTWDDQQQEFARFLLVEFCALYEAWCEGSLSELSQNKFLSKKLQFPTTLTGVVASDGVGYALHTIGSAMSPAMSAALYPVLRKNKKYSKQKLEQLLICYRYYKELRNSLVHAGGIASVNFNAAELAYKALSAASLGVKEKPEYLPQVPGNSVAISLRGVVGFGEIVLRLICTLDAEFSQSISAEKAFLVRWKAKHGNKPILIAAKKHDRVSRIKRLVRKIDLPKPIVTTQFESWLKKNQLIN